MSDKLPTFERAPFGKQVFTKYTMKKFDLWPDHVRKFLAEVMNHGDINRAAEASGVANNTDLGYRPGVNMTEAMEEANVTSGILLHHLMECLDANTYKVDKDGNPIKDLRLKLKTLELIFRLRGDFGQEVQDNTAKGVLEMFKDGPSAKGTRKASKERKG